MCRAIALQLPLFKEHQWIWCTSRPSRRPSDRFSLAYCLWLAKNPRQRYEVLVYQGFKCWKCRVVLNPRWMHLHHPFGYRDQRTGESIVGYENPTELVAVHRICHRNIHEAAEQTREWCNAA